MIEISGVKAASAKQLEEYQREQAKVDALTAHPIKILPRMIEICEVREESKESGQLDFAGLGGVESRLPVRMPKKRKANNSQSYWRTQILELVSEQWCNGDNQRMKASSSQVTLQGKVGRELVLVRVAHCDLLSYMDLANWLACFNDESLAPQK